MRTTRSLAAAAAVLAFAAAPAAAQDSGVQPYRFTVEGFLQQNWFGEKAAPGTKDNLGGFGGRLMFNRSDASKALRSFVDRGSIGVYASFTAKQGGSLDASTTQYGVEGDVALLPTALYGRLDPFVSLGVGALRTSYAARLNVPGASGNVTRNSFALTPAIGTRIPLFSGIGLRGDIRLPLTFGDAQAVSVGADGGLYVSF